MKNLYSVSVASHHRFLFAAKDVIGADVQNKQISVENKAYNDVAVWTKDAANKLGDDVSTYIKKENLKKDLLTK